MLTSLHVQLSKFTEDFTDYIFELCCRNKAAPVHPWSSKLHARPISQLYFALFRMLITYIFNGHCPDEVCIAYCLLPYVTCCIYIIHCFYPLLNQLCFNNNNANKQAFVCSSVNSSGVRDPGISSF